MGNNQFWQEQGKRTLPVVSGCVVDPHILLEGALWQCLNVKHAHSLKFYEAKI